MWLRANLQFLRMSSRLPEPASSSLFPGGIIPANGPGFLRSRPALLIVGLQETHVRKNYRVSACGSRFRVTSVELVAFRIACAIGLLCSC